MGDVGEGAAVDKCRRAFQGLDQVRLDGILQKGCRRAGGLQVVHSHRLVVVGVADDGPCKALLQIRDGRREAEGRHDLGSDGDVVAVLTGHAVRADAEAADDGAELAVVHIHRTLPGDALRIDAEGVALVDMVVQHGRDQVVGSADGVEIAGKVEVDVLHGDDLGPAAAGSAALDAEDRSQGRLAEGEDGVLSDLPETVRKTDGSGGLAFAGRSRGDGGD